MAVVKTTMLHWQAVFPGEVMETLVDDKGRVLGVKTCRGTYRYDWDRKKYHKELAI